MIRQFEELLSIYEFVEQQHRFNFPYQLGKGDMGDDPSHSICMRMEVKEGDIVVVGSDGLFDNVSFLEVLHGVKKSLNDGILLTGLPEMLARLAIERGQDKDFNSPFAQRAKELGLSFEGGKLDDTTVIIARIKNEEIEDL